MQEKPWWAWVMANNYVLWRVVMISCADYALKHALLELNGTCMVQIRTQHTYILTCAHNRLLRALNDSLTVCAVRPTITYVFGLQKPCNRNCKYLYHRSADWKWQWSVVHSCPNLYLLSQKSDMSCPVPLNVFSGQTDRQQLTRRPVSEGANFAVASLTVNDS